MILPPAGAGRRFGFTGWGRGGARSTKIRMGMRPLGMVSYWGERTGRMQAGRRGIWTKKSLRATEWPPTAVKRTLWRAISMRLAMNGGFGMRFLSISVSRTIDAIAEIRMWKWLKAFRKVFPSGRDRGFLGGSDWGWFSGLGAWVGGFEAFENGGCRGEEGLVGRDAGGFGGLEIEVADGLH